MQICSFRRNHKASFLGAVCTLALCAGWADGAIAQNSQRSPDSRANPAQTVQWVAPSPEFSEALIRWNAAQQAGHYADALRHSAEMMQLAKSNTNKRELTYALAARAHTLQALGRYAEAEPLARQAIPSTKATLGEKHPPYAVRLSDLATILLSMGRFEEAEPLYRQAMAITKAAIGEHHPDYATRLNNLAVLYYFTERFSEVEGLMQEALKIRQAALPAGHPDIAQSESNPAAIRAKLD